MGDPPATTGSAAAPLSRREREVLLGMARGDRMARIADRLAISKRTVEFHAANARAKLGARTREHAVALAILRGLIAP